MLSGYNWVDFLIIAVIALSSLISLVRGFVREAISLLAWVLAFIVAFKFSNQTASIFDGLVSNPSFRVALAFLLLFFGTLLAGAVVNYVVCLAVSKTGFTGFIDRLLGLIFGAARGILLIAVLVLLGQIADYQTSKEWWAQSSLIPKFYGLSAWLNKFVPEQFDQLKNSVTVIPPVPLEETRQSIDATTEVIVPNQGN